MTQDHLRVLSVASGSTGEVRDLFATLPDIPFDVFLLDQDGDALDFVKTAVEAGPPASAHLHPLQMHVRDVTKGALKVYSTGLYDYLPQPFAVELTQRLIDILAPDGQLLIANYSKENINSARFIVEYAHDWFITTRDKAQMLRLIGQNEFEDVQIVQDAATNIIHILIAGHPVRS